MQRFQRFTHQWSWVILLSFCIIGLRYPVIGVSALICMAAPVITAFFKGRAWCGNFCPRGSFNDIILARISLSKRIPAFFKASWVKILFLMVLMGAFAVQLTLAWGNPVSVGAVFVRIIIITTLLAIILGIFHHQRTWCLICPMGTMAHYVVKLKFVRDRIKHVAFDKDKCISCKVCTKNCPVNIEVHSYKEKGRVLHSDCLKCNTCVDKCPKKSLSVA